MPRDIWWTRTLAASNARDFVGRRFEVFSPTGAPVAHVPIEVPLSSGMPTVITRDRVYTWMQDWDGLVSLIALRIDRVRR